jgi:hypothetical protein
MPCPIPRSVSSISACAATTGKLAAFCSTPRSPTSRSAQFVLAERWSVWSDVSLWHLWHEYCRLLAGAGSHRQEQARGELHAAAPVRRLQRSVLQCPVSRQQLLQARGARSHARLLLLRVPQDVRTAPVSAGAAVRQADGAAPRRRRQRSDGLLRAICIDVCRFDPCKGTEPTDEICGLLSDPDSKPLQLYREPTECCAKCKRPVRHRGVHQQPRRRAPPPTARRAICWRRCAARAAASACTCAIATTAPRAS